MGHKKRSFYRATPKREPLSRIWFLSRGYKQANPDYTNGYTIWLHPETNDVLNQYGQKAPLVMVPYEKYHKTSAVYLKLTGTYGGMYLARLKYLTFKGEIKPDEEVDHIDGNTLNNNIDNLRSIHKSINYRDAGFMRKLRNKGIRPELFSGALLGYYERMAVFKETHTQWQYDCLTREDLMRLLVGPRFTIVNPSVVDEFPSIIS